VFAYMAYGTSALIAVVAFIAIKRGMGVLGVMPVTTYTAGQVIRVASVLSRATTMSQAC
jgi:hypothetical protein